MTNDSKPKQDVQIRVPFHGAELLLIQHDGQPYTPMKPIVEGMGLDWGGQHKKLAANQDRWGVSVMEIPSPGGPQEALCLPLRKLGGWLMTVHASRVRSEVRAKVIEYQNECDDVLWQYWNEGVAVNPRMPFVVNDGDVLTADQQETLRLMVKTLAERLPKKQQGAATIKAWSKLKAHFKVPYRQIPQAEFTEAVSIVTRTAAEWEVVEDPVALDAVSTEAAIETALTTGRWLMTASNGTLTLKPAHDAYVLTEDQFARFLRSPGSVPKRLLPEIIAACVERLTEFA